MSPASPASRARPGRLTLEPPASRRSWRSMAAVLAAVAGCAVVLLWRVGRAPYLFDEQLYAAKGWEYVHPDSLSHRTITQGNFEHPPLAKLAFGWSQLLLGDPQGVTASRVVAALAALAAACLVGAAVSRVAGRTWGLLTMVSFALLPSSVSPQTTPVGRSALLDSVMVCFVAASVWCALGWLQARSERSAWAWALAFGASTGLATACKENGFLAAPGLVLALLVLRRETAGREVLRGLVAAATCLVVFVAAYLPFDQPLGHVRYLIDYQSQHSTAGHPVGVAGAVYAHPPWWATLWFAGESLGPVVVAVALSGMTLALLAPSRPAALVLAGLAGPVAFHCFVAGVSLGFYWYAWWPLALTAAVMGLAAAPAVARPLGRLALPVSRGVQLVAAAAVLLLAMGTTGRIFTLPVEGGAGIVAARRAAGLQGAVLAAGVYPVEILPADRSLRIRTRVVPAELGGIDTLVVGASRCRTVPDRPTLALIRGAVDLGAAQEIYRDRLYTAYRVTGALAPPDDQQLAALPLRRPSDGC